MAEKSNSEVRNHSSEREWLRSRGNGSVAQGARTVVEETRKEQSSSNKNTGR